MLLSPADSATIARLKERGYAFDRGGDGILVRDDRNSVVGRFRDLTDFLDFVKMTANQRGGTSI